MHGEQISQVLGIYVESFIMGYGSCCHYGYWSSTPQSVLLKKIMMVLRDGKWTEQEAAILVPGDFISIKLGYIVPVDAHLLEGDPLKIDQSALTGESLPITKNPYDEVFSSSTCKQVEIEAVVIATSVHTFLTTIEVYSPRE